MPESRPVSRFERWRREFREDVEEFNQAADELGRLLAKRLIDPPLRRLARWLDRRRS